MFRAFVMAAAVVLGTGVAQADGDVAKGEQAYKKCVACHSITDKSNKTGPSLLGIVGQKAGIAEGYKYSEAFLTFAATGAVWDEATLDAWLANPKAVVKGTKMAFVGLKKEDEREDLIAYLASKK